MNTPKYKWHKLAEPGEFLVKEGVIMKWAVPGKHFCITQYNGKYYAFQSKCPHAGAAFDEGWLDDSGLLVCPLHRFKFNMITGANAEGFGLVRFPVEENEHGIWLGIKEQSY